MNKITLIGNLGRDPEMNYTPNGVANKILPRCQSRHEVEYR